MLSFAELSEPSGVDTLQFYVPVAVFENNQNDILEGAHTRFSASNGGKDSAGTVRETECPFL